MYDKDGVTVINDVLIQNPIVVGYSVFYYEIMSLRVNVPTTKRGVTFSSSFLITYGLRM